MACGGLTAKKTLYDLIPFIGRKKILNGFNSHIGLEAGAYNKRTCENQFGGLSNVVTRAAFFTNRGASKVLTT